GRSIAMPAALTTAMSSPRVLAADTAASTRASSETSHVNVFSIATPMESAAEPSASGLRSNRNTCQPLAVTTRAVSSPMPEAPPVINPTLPTLPPIEATHVLVATGSAPASHDQVWSYDIAGSNRAADYGHRNHP